MQSLWLENFGLYGGANTFDLQSDPTNGKQVIVIKGHNGSGKTTFLEAIRLAIYGKRSLGPRVSRSEYELYLLEKINVLAPTRRASVSLTFSLREDGEVQFYEVTRSWATRGSSVLDTLQLKRDGEALDDIPREDWEHYLEDLIPPGVSQLFFFDGEKIQDIADGEVTDGLRDAVRSLLGLDLIEQLRNDLAIYTVRADEDAFDDDFEAIQRDIVTKRNELVLKEEEAADLTSRRDQVARRIERAQKAFQNEGGRVALDRGALKRAQAACNRRIESLQSELKRLANGPLPLGLAPSLIERLQSLVTGESSHGSRRAVKTFLTVFEAYKLENPTKRPAWTKRHFAAMRHYLEAQGGKTEILLDGQSDWIADRLELMKSGFRLEVLSVGEHLDEAFRERGLLKIQLRSLDSNAATDALEVLKSAEYDLGAVETKLRATTANIDSQRFQIGSLEKVTIRAREALLHRQYQDRRLDLARRAQRALVDYESRILDQRLAALSTHFVECFNGLIRKKRLVSTVEVDPKSFAISLVGEDGARISKDLLSAGERQIFAISMLWALGKTSGRELPMIIDTPLSRLDSHHRRAIMERYVSEASHQVILLCTDTEFTDDLEAIIDGHVARRFELGVADGTRQTTVRRATMREERAVAHAY